MLVTLLLPFLILKSQGVSVKHSTERMQSNGKKPLMVNISH